MNNDSFEGESLREKAQAPLALVLIFLLFVLMGTIEWL